MKIDLKRPRHWFLLLKQGLYAAIVIALRPFCGRPEEPLVILYGHQLSGNLRALYLAWRDRERKEFDLYFLSLDPEYGAQLQRAGYRTLQCNRLADMLKLTRATAVVSDHGLHMMTPLVRFTSLLFIDVWHGIPFKGFVPDDFKVQHNYEEIWVSSKLIKRMYEEKFGFQESRVRSLGYARTDRLFNCDSSESDFRSAAGITAGTRLVLYAPTWQQDDSGRELFPFDQTGQTFITAMLDICTERGAMLVIRSHLNTDIDRHAGNGVLYCSQKDFPDTEELLLSTDVLICDWSSIAFDFLALDRPTIFLDVEPPFRNGFSLGREYRFGKVVGNMASLGDTLAACLDNPEQYREEQGALHREITDKLYDADLRGVAARQQCARLEYLVDTA